MRKTKTEYRVRMSKREHGNYTDIVFTSSRGCDEENTKELALECKRKHEKENEYPFIKIVRVDYFRSEHIIDLS